MTRRAAVFLLASLLLHAVGDGAGAQQRRWTVEDVLAMKSAGQVAISPGGEWIAYVVTQRDLENGKNLSHIWLVRGEGGAPVQLTRGDGSERAPAWAPDGSWLGFLSGRDGAAQVYGIRPGGGEAWKVTEAKTAVASFAVAPDGRHIAFTARPEETAADKEVKKQRGRPLVWDSAYATDWTQLWVASLADGVAGELARSSPEGLSVGGFVWGPDSRGLAWSGVGMADPKSAASRDRTTGFSRESDIYVQDAAGSNPRRVTTMRGGEVPQAWIDGLGIVFAATGQELGTFNRKLWRVDASGGDALALTEALDENATLVLGTTDALLVEAQYRTGSRLYRIALNRGRPVAAPQVVSDDKLLYTGFSATVDGATVALVAQGPAAPPEVHVTPTRRFAPRRLTELNPVAAALALGEQRVVRWTSAHDGEEIEGVLTLPVGYTSGRVPLLLIIHGGPSGVSANGFNPGGRYASQVFAGLGYASLQPNYRGSTGYGERFRGLNRGHISGHDWIDVNSGVDQMIAQGIADPDRLGIMGWSFGGHHTFWAITQTDRFKAASAGAGANDLISMYSQTDLPGFYHTYLGPRPWEDFALYEQRSAYRFVDRVTTPLLIQVGENDERVPAEQSIQFYEAMTGIGKAPAKLVIYPGEGHGLREVGHIRDMMQRNVEWFTQWIPTRGTAAAGGRE